MNKQLITFLYHEVTDDPSSSGFQRQGALPYKHKVQHFLDNLDVIQNVFNHSIIVDDHKKNEGNSLILTFDDGGSSALTIAKILDTRALVGHFFVTTSMIGAPGFLNEDEIRELDRRGHIIGSHSHSHPNIFRDISFEQKIEEWQVSKQILEKILCKDVVSASIPGGDMDDETIETAAKTGIHYLFTSEPNYTPYLKYGVWVFGRVCPKNTTSTADIRTWTNGRGYLKAKMIRSLKELIRTKLKFLYQAYVRINEKRI